MENKYPPDSIACSPEYLARHSALFEEIKYKYASLGTKSLITAQQQSSPISEIIANMSPDKATQEIRNIIKDLRNSSGPFTVGMKEKADRIEAEMGKMPLNERSSFLATLKAKLLDQRPAPAAAQQNEPEHGPVVKPN